MKKKKPLTEDQPPIFNSWKRWYVVVLISLAVLIILFSWFTIAFNA